MSRDSRERTLISKLTEALTSSLNLSEVFTNAEDLLFRLTPADYMALCVSRPGPQGDYHYCVSSVRSPTGAARKRLAGRLVSKVDSCVLLGRWSTIQ
ncbi:hypothetical protein BO221_42855 [Archangium sp. Cb G35]|uniref:hypothetical protein n=1 Tax=Archangium sp. Cb G35 TaxID=1920190 RepID=UPI000937F9BD|nr:hypothetical protein [Archangium sp. Cb G35]OJT17748.1 hypothetical protein BO221_42855 [Archangium sp. Cb G35]